MGLPRHSSLPPLAEGVPPTKGRRGGWGAPTNGPYDATALNSESLSPPYLPAPIRLRLRGTTARIFSRNRAEAVGA